MSSKLQVFTYGDQEIRTALINGEPWLVAKDVCEVLELSNPTMAVQELDEDERAKYYLGRSPIHGGGGEVNVINEAGLYKLTFKSRKPVAKKFTRWVTHEVLPTLRKTGSYSLDVAPVEQPAMPKLPEHSGVIKAAERIVHKAFKCKAEPDYQEVLALDKVFKQTFGVSVLELAGLRLVRKTQRVRYRIEMSIGYDYDYREEEVFSWEHDYPRLSDE